MEQSSAQPFFSDEPYISIRTDHVNLGDQYSQALKAAKNTIAIIKLKPRVMAKP